MNKYLIGAIAVLALLASGFWVGRKVTKPQAVYTVDSLSVVQKDSINAYWKTKLNIVTKSIKIKPNKIDPAKKDTLWQVDSTEANGWMQIALELQRQIEQMSSQTVTGPDPAPAKAQNINIGIVGGLSYGLKDKDLAPIVAVPIRYRHVLFMPFVDYPGQIRIGAGVGLTF